MIYSKNFILWLTELEGFLPYVYDDVTHKPSSNGNYIGYPTFGIGHLITSKTDPLLKFTKQSPATKEFVSQLLEKDLQRYVDAVVSGVGRPLLPHQYDALISFCFNIGTDGFKSSTVCKLVKANTAIGLEQAFNNWTKSKGKVLPTLVDRRKIEYKLFMTGVYTTYGNKLLTAKK